MIDAASNSSVYRSLTAILDYATSIVVCLCVLALQPVKADIAPDPITGGVNPITRANTQIELVSEVVNIYANKKGFKTNAEFHLHNSGPEVTTEIGFPFFPFTDEHIEQLNVFSASIDGTPVKTIKTDFSPTANTNDVIAPPSDKWKHWPVHLTVGQNATIKVSYENDMPKIIDPSSALDQQLLNEDGKTGFYRDLLEPKAYQIQYQLATGSLWKGPIVDCKIVLHTDGIGREKVRSVMPLPEEINKDTIVWQWKHFKPRRDLYFYLFDECTEMQQIQGLKDAIGKDPNNPRLTACLGMLDWLQGDQPKSLAFFKDYLMKNSSSTASKKTHEDKIAEILMIASWVRFTEKRGLQSDARELAPVIADSVQRYCHSEEMVPEFFQTSADDWQNWLHKYGSAQ
jgi:hypothetical protein